MKEKEYVRAKNLIHITLDNLYNNFSSVKDVLDKNLINIVNTEAPLTLNTLKARFREIFDVAKISGKALDIISEEINSLGFCVTEELYDLVIWPKGGKFQIDYLRINSDRLIYDIPYDEFKNLANNFDLKGEELYRKILAYFNLEVLTQKAHDYLAFIEGGK